MKRLGTLVLILFCSLFSYSQTKVDSAINVLKGTWRWDYQRGGFAPLPPSPASFSAHLVFSQDVQDSLNQTLTYQRYRGNSLEKSARTFITWQYNNGYHDVFNFLPDVFPFFGNDTIASEFWFMSDTLEITWQGADIPTFGFLRDTIFNPYQLIDSIIERLEGCWKWDHYFGGFGGLPPRPATSNVRVEFRQDAQDSLNHTISCQSFKDSMLHFSGRCDVEYDTNWAPFFILSCPIFDSIGIVGSAPFYFYFKNDTLLFPQESFVDGYVYGFLQNCYDSTVTGNFDPEDFAMVYPNPASEQIIIQFNHGLFKAALFNLVGQQIAYGESLAGKIAFDVSNLPEGSYLIRIETQKAVMVRKILIQ